MAPPLVVSNPKITMGFNGGVNGWTESHFYTSQVPLTDAGLMADAVNLVAKRCAALDGVNSKLVMARISLDDVNRDSEQVQTIPAPDPIKGYYSQGGPDPSDTATWSYQTVQVSWPVILKTDSSTTNPIEYLAGMPARNKQDGSLPNASPAPTPQSYLIKYLNYLTTGKWGALARSWSGLAYLVTAFTYVPAAGAAPPQFQFTFGAPFPDRTIFPAGGLFRLNGFTYTTPQKLVRYNGTYQVENYNASTGVLTTNVPRAIVAPVPSMFGSIEAATGAVVPYRAYTFRPITHRKRGRPLLAGRGRR